MTFGIIVFVATLHLMFGYALAVYLGHASFGPRETVSNTNSRPLFGEEEIGIADDLEGRAHADHGARHAGPEFPDGMLESQDNEHGLQDGADASPDGESTGSVPPHDSMEHEPSSHTTAPASFSLPVSPPPPLDSSESVAVDPTIADQHGLAESEHLQPAVATTLTEELIRWLGLLNEFRQEVLRVAELLWDGMEADPSPVFGDDVDIPGSIASILREMEGNARVVDSDGLSRQRTEQGLAAREHFSTCLSETMHRLEAMDSSDHATYRENLQLAILEVGNAIHEFEESLTEFQLDMWQDAGGLGNLHPDLLFDARSGLPAGLGMAEQWQDFGKAEDGGAQSKVFAMFDLDNSHRLNKEIGPAWTDRLIANVANIARQTLPETWILGRYTGQRFLIGIPNQTASTAGKDIEHLRAEIAATSFLSKFGEQRATITCALVDTSPDDSIKDTLGRLLETLGEAKDFGRNRTFLHDGTYPAPMVPTAFDIEKQVLDLNLARPEKILDPSWKVSVHY